MTGAPPESMPQGGRIGRYHLIRRLGAGAMGEVFLARDPRIDRLLAVKTVRLGGGFVAAGGEAEETRERLLREAKAAGRLLHPNVVTLFDAGEAQGELFLAFEYVDGSDLGRRMSEGPRPSLGDILRIVREVAQGLHYAHRLGVIHRDIKPGNILLDQGGTAKLADFGIARLTGQATELTTTGAVIGSPQYLAPEQVRGEDLDGRNDLFSLGVVFYQLLTGQRPFGGETVTTLVYQILNHEPTPVGELCPALPPEVGAVVTRLLAKDREERFGSAEALVEALEELEESLPPELLAAGVRPSSEGSGSTRPLAQAETRLVGETRRPRRGLALALALVLALAAVAWLGSRDRQDGAGRAVPAVTSGLAPGAGEESPPGSPAGLPGSRQAGEERGGEEAPTLAPIRESGGDPIAGGGDGPEGPLGEEPAITEEGPPPPPVSAIEAGLDLSFRVQPPDAFVAVNGRMAGKIQRWAAGGQSFRLPRPGEYRLVFRRQGYRESEVLIRAEEDRPGVTAVVVRLDRLPEGVASMGGVLDRYEVREAVAFKVLPPRARIMVEGRIRGAVAQFSGGSGGWLSLGPGSHRVMVSAPGHRPVEVEILVSPQAEAERRIINLQLQRRSRQ